MSSLTEAEELTAIAQSLKNKKSISVYYTSLSRLPTVNAANSCHQKSTEYSIPAEKALEDGAEVRQFLPFPQYAGCSLLNKPLFFHRISTEVKL